MSNKNNTVRLKDFNSLDKSIMKQICQKKRLTYRYIVLCSSLTSLLLCVENDLSNSFPEFVSPVECAYLVWQMWLKGLPSKTPRSSDTEVTPGTKPTSLVSRGGLRFHLISRQKLIINLSTFVPN